MFTLHPLKYSYKLLNILYLILITINILYIYDIIPFCSTQQIDGALNFNGKEIPLRIRTIPDDLPTPENRFGVSLSHALQFINAFKNQKIKGFKICHKYPMSSKSTSVHAETFLWNLQDYKVFSS